MNLGLSEDQQFFQETTRKFLEQEAPLTTVRALADAADGFDRAWWVRGAELGWASFLVPEDDGGGSLSGEGVVDLAIVAEEMGRLVSPGPLVPTNVVADAVARGGSAALRAEVLPGIVAGEIVAAWCIAGPGGGWDEHGVAIGAVRNGEALVLDGVSTPVEYAAQADELLVTARTDGGLTQCLVPASAAGVHVEAIESVDLVRRFATVHLEGVQVSPDRIVGEIGGAADAVERQLHLSVALQCAETVGALDRVLDFTLEYLADRSSFGRPLASYQAIKHRIADMKMWIEGSHGVTELAVQAVQDDDPEAAEIVSAAASYLGDHAGEILQECTQLHGGIGVTWEHDLHLYLRRVTLDRNLFGTPAQHRERIADRIITRHGASIEPEVAGADQTESVEEFQLRVRAWLADNMPVLAPDAPPPDRAEDDETWVRDKQLQRMLWDGGFAGICFPKEFGGLGLTIEHQHAFTEESMPYEMPLHLNVPHFSILGATLVDFGTDEQKAKYLPPMLKGEQQWVQFLSEPTGGSDLAGCLTRAERDGDEWVMNGSKIWSTAAMSATHAMCLARTDWDSPKHRGLTMFIMEIHQEGVQVDPIRQVNGSLEFCQEFFDDVRLPPDSVVGDVNDGWTVALALLAHERNAVGGGSPYISGRNYLAEGADGAFDASCVKLVTQRGTADDPVARQLVAEAHVLDVVQRGLVRRVSLGMETGALVGQSAAITKLFTATSAERKTTIRLELAGPDALTWPVGAETSGRGAGEDYLERQATSLAGGSNEIQRNLIAERVLGMPREWAADRDIPYKDVRSNAMPTSPGG